MEHKKTTKELIELKHKIMAKRINKLYGIYSLLSNASTKTGPSPLVDLEKQFRDIKIIREQYGKMYDAVIEGEEYEKYREIEDTIIAKIAEIELNLDIIISRTSGNYQEVITSIIESIKKATNYQEYLNLYSEREKIKPLKQLLELYEPYISKKEMQSTKDQISELKFDIQYRMQTKELLGRGIWLKSAFTKFDDDAEKSFFIELVRRKKMKLTNPVDRSKNPDILRTDSKEILFKPECMEELIMVDMEKNPKDFIDILKVPIFDPYECDLAPAKDIKYDYNGFSAEACRLQGKDFELLSISMVKAFVDSTIKDRRMSIIDCDRIYRKFGYECIPPTYTRGQLQMQKFWNSLKETEEYKALLNATAETKCQTKDTKKKYCKFYLDGIRYRKDILPLNEYVLVSILKQIQDECERETQKSTIQMSNWAETMLLPDGWEYSEKIANADVHIDQVKKIMEIVKTEGPQDYLVDELLDTVYFIDDALSDENINLSKGFLIEEAHRAHISEETHMVVEVMMQMMKESGKDIDKFTESESNEKDYKISLYLDLDDISDLPIDYEKAEIVSVDEKEQDAKEQEAEER